jgi:hypothetical protein
MRDQGSWARSSSVGAFQATVRSPSGLTAPNTPRSVRSLPLASVAEIQTQVRHRLQSVLARRGVLTPIELIERLAALDSHTTPAGC